MVLISRSPIRSTQHRALRFEHLFVVFPHVLKASQGIVYNLMRGWSLLQLLVRAATDRPFAAVIPKRYARFRRKLTTLIERRQSEGVVCSGIPADLLADQVSAMGDGWTMMFPVETNRFSRGRINDLVNVAIAIAFALIAVRVVSFLYEFRKGES